MLFSAANLDRGRLVRIPRSQDVWLIDPRISFMTPSLQAGNELYSDNPFDRGHIVSRNLVMWGTAADARLASSSTFFYSNAMPQHENFNRGAWAGLEDFVQSHIESRASRLSVFAGPVFRTDDWVYRERSIPRSYWKIVVARGASNARPVVAYGFMLHQYRIQGGDVEWLPLTRAFDARDHRVRISEIESLTGLDFGPLRDHEGPPLMGME